MHLCIVCITVSSKLCVFSTTYTWVVFYYDVVAWKILVHNTLVGVLPLFLITFRFIVFLFSQRSKLKHEDLREVQQALKDAHWADDDQVTNCKGCEKTFNLSRRKVC